MKMSLVVMSCPVIMLVMMIGEHFVELEILTPLEHLMIVTSAVRYLFISSVFASQIQFFHSQFNYMLGSNVMLLYFSKFHLMVGDSLLDPLVGEYRVGLLMIRVLWVLGAWTQVQL
jgi:hypothetical protein